MWFWFTFVYSIIVPLGVLLVPKWLLANKIQKGIEGNLSVGSALLNLLPWFNSYRIKKGIEGKAPVYFALSIYTAVTIALLIPARFIFIEDVTVQIAMTMWMMLFLVVTYISELALMIYLCKMFDRKKAVFAAILPFFCSALLIPHISPYFQKYKDEIEGTFNVGE